MKWAAVTPEAFPGGHSAGMNIAPIGGDAGIMAMRADEIYMIGDCAILGRIREATEAGERVGRWL